MVSAPNLRQCLENQGYRELAAAHLLAIGVVYAPTLDDKQMLADHARDELRHFEVVSGMYEEAYRVALEPVVAARLAGLPQPSSWLEASLASYVFDRAVFCQLEVYQAASDLSLRRLAAATVEQEREHQRAAEVALIDQSKDGAFVAETAQEFLSHWFAVALRSLDSTDPSLTTRVVEDVRSTLAACGLQVPEVIELSVTRTARAQPSR